jgi:hypothetical protein
MPRNPAPLSPGSVLPPLDVPPLPGIVSSLLPPSGFVQSSSVGGVSPGGVCSSGANVHFLWSG